MLSNQQLKLPEILSDTVDNNGLNSLADIRSHWMSDIKNVEYLAEKIAVMGRDGLVEILRALDCSFSIDFTDEYLKNLSLDRLRHLVLAACLHDRPKQARCG